jgi:REP element-mobilizing transposase RayT
MGDKPVRKRTRLQGFDYSRAGAYFVTVCTKERRCMLADIVPGNTRCAEDDEESCVSLVGAGVLDGPRPRLTPYGRVAGKYMQQMSAFYDTVSVSDYVIMPNHIHFILVVEPNGPSGTPAPTATPTNAVVSRFVSTFKRFCNKEYGRNIWQPHFHDHIIRNDDDLDRHRRYIAENPLRWQEDELYTSL